MACFQFDEPALSDLHRPHGHFTIVVRATTPDKALDLCRTRLRELRTTTSLFDTPSTIYLDHLIAIPDVQTKPALVNYSHTLYFEDSGKGEVLCGLPEQEELGGEFEVFGLSNKKKDAPPEFLDFGGQRAHEALQAAAQGRPSSHLTPPHPSPRPPRPSSRPSSPRRRGPG